MELDRPGTQKHRLADLGIGASLRDEQGDLQLLRGKLLAAVTGAGNGLAAGAEFGAGPLGPGPGVETVEDVGCSAQLSACVPSPPRPAQPFSVDEPGTCVLEYDVAALMQPDGLLEMSVEVVRDDALTPCGSGR